MTKKLEIKVRTVLLERDLKLKDLAEQLNISSAYLSDILKGNRDGAKAQEYVKKIIYILDIKGEE